MAGDLDLMQSCDLFHSSIILREKLRSSVRPCDVVIRLVTLCVLSAVPLPIKHIVVCDDTEDEVTFNVPAENTDDEIVSPLLIHNTQSMP